MSIVQLVRRLGAPALATALLLPPSAHALTANAHLDWSGMVVSVQDTAPDDGIDASFSMGFRDSAIAFCIFSPGGGSSCDPTLPYVEDWDTTLTTTFNGSGVTALASMSSSEMSALLDGTAPPGTHWLDASRMGDFLMSGAGRLTVSLPFSVQLIGDDPEGLQFAHAMASIELAQRSYSSEFAFSGYGPRSLAGTLTASVDAADGELVRLLAVANSQLSTAWRTPPITSPVPEPGALAMASAGLGLVGWRIRRRRVTQGASAG